MSLVNREFDAAEATTEPPSLPPLVSLLFMVRRSPVSPAVSHRVSGSKPSEHINTK